MVEDFNPALHATPLYSMWLRRQVDEKVAAIQAREKKLREQVAEARRIFDAACAEEEKRYQRRQLEERSARFDGRVEDFGLGVFITLATFAAVGAFIHP